MNCSGVLRVVLFDSMYSRAEQPTLPWPWFWVSPQVVCTAAITLVLALSRPPLRWRQRFFVWCPPTWKGGGSGSDRGSCESSEQRVEIHPSCLKTSPSMCLWLASIFWDDTVDDLHWFFTVICRLMAMGHCNVRISFSKLRSLCLLSLCYPPLSSLSLCSSCSMPGPFLAFCEYLQSVLTTTKRPTSTDDHMPGRIMAWPVAKYVFWWNEGYVLKCFLLSQSGLRILSAEHYRTNMALSEHLGL